MTGTSSAKGTPSSEMLVCLFEHTDHGSYALRDLLGAGVDHAAIHVIGDLGLASGERGAEHHVTLDMLHIPPEHRALFMDTIRDGGVVLAMQDHVELMEAARRIASEHKAMMVLQLTSSRQNPSHNLAS